ncbi:FecR domain-containing protein [Sphingomonas sp. ST-64]|uniref:FecR domain-containing protein n=1 Tax=Sphingomonas plantiphila TaxID=3163295 RepID=A0ABW8YNF0_9SPHN
MSARLDRAVIEQAIAWHLRLQDGDADAWIEFTEWLEADPAHNQAYEAVVDDDARVSGLLARASFPTGHDQGGPVGSADALFEEGGDASVRRSGWRWGAVAASIAVAGLFGVQMLSEEDRRYAVETPAGETRRLSLADGSEIQLNGGTRIVLDRKDARSVELAHGEVRLIVRHDESDPFVVVAGEQRLIDLGTVFNVIRTDRQLRVAVSEGAVRYEGAVRSVDLRPGDSLATDGLGKVEVSQKPIAAIGSWADGKLVYDQAPLGEVADDLSRSVGISLELPQAMRARRFSGVIHIGGKREALRDRLEELMGETIVADGTRWSVEAR